MRNPGPAPSGQTTAKVVVIAIAVGGHPRPAGGGTRGLPTRGARGLPAQMCPLKWAPGPEVSMGTAEEALLQQMRERRESEAKALRKRRGRRRATACLDLRYPARVPGHSARGARSSPLRTCMHALDRQRAGRV
jgi:hypothetical protein